MKRTAAVALCLALTACGATTGNDGQQAGGGAISKGAVADSTGDSSDDAVVLKLATEGDLGGRLISGVEFTLRLPSGVTLDATDDGKVATGEVCASGANKDPEYVMARYTAGKVKVAVINTKGFSGGEFLTISCNRAKGVAVAATDFSVEDFSAADFSPAAIAGAVPAVTVDIR